MNRNVRIGAALLGAALCVGLGVLLGGKMSAGVPVADRSREQQPGLRSAPTGNPPGRSSPVPESSAEGSAPVGSDSAVASPVVSGRDRLDPLLSELRAALVAGDDELRAGVIGRLAAWIGTDAARALALVERFRTEDEPEFLAALVEVLRANPTSARSPEVAEAFVRIVRSDPAPARRALALSFLAGCDGSLPDERLLPPVLESARSEKDPHVRAAAANLLSAALERKPPQSGEVFRVLAEIARTDPHEDVRGLVVQSLPLRWGNGEAVETVGAVLADDAAAGVRAAAALALGDPPPDRRGRAGELLQDSLARERDPEVRRTAVTSIVRIGKDTALPLLERLAREHPDLAEHIADYRGILETGETDMDRIWEAKRRREIERGAPEQAHGPEETD